MKEAILFENSALSEYRTNMPPVDPKKVQLLQNVLKKFRLNLNDVIITDRQYLEASGNGQIRAAIIKEHKDRINKEKPSAITDIKDIIILESYVTFLEQLFSSELRNHLPRSKIRDMWHQSQKDYPLDVALLPVQKTLQLHGNSLFKFYSDFERFITTLVEDSVVRCALDFLNFKEIPTAQKDHAMQLLGSMVSLLMTKYASSQVLHTNINLLASAIRTAILATKNPQSPTQRMFRIPDDIADIEPTHFMLYGVRLENQRVPVTIITREPKPAVIERLNYDMTSAGVKAQNIKPQILLLGRIILLDFHNYTDDVITGKYLQENFKTESGQPLY